MFDINNYNKDLGNLNKSYKKILDNSKNLKSNIDYFPFWQNNKEDFKLVLKNIKENIENVINLEEKTSQINYCVVATITAELSDAFYTKKEGIEIICECLSYCFKDHIIKLINVKGDFVDIDEALKDYLSVSASNWVSTSYVLGEYEKYAILLDIGSTTLDLIPIKDGIPVPEGTNDLDRLSNGELFYTGVLRPPISSIVQEVPYRGKMIPISFEYFANAADVYSILKKISVKEYICDTADKRDKNLENCYARISRIICGDLLMVDKTDLDKIAIYIYERHKELIENAINKSINTYIQRFRLEKADLKFIITGLGKDLILKPILQDLGIKSNQIIEKKLSEIEHILSTAFCLGIHYICKLLN